MRSFIRTLLAAALLSASLAHAAVEVAGITFTPQATVDNSTLSLNGAGLRTRLTFKVYAMGLYLRTPATRTADILQDSGEKRIRMVMIRDLDGKQFADALLAGLQRNHDSDTLAALRPATEALLAAVLGSGDLKSGTDLMLDQLANGATRLLINGEQRGNDITDLALYPALLRVWLGERPADAELKADLLKHAR